jgi:hypothetical protein
VSTGVDGAALREHAVPVGLADTRHPALRAREDPVVAVADGARPQAHDVAAGLRLRETERGTCLTRGDRSYIALVLLRGPGDHDRPGRQPREEQHERGGVRVLGDLFDRDAQAEDAGSGAPVLLGDAQSGQAGVDEEREEVFRVFLALVDVACTGRDTLLGQLADGGLELGELVRELEIHSR